jgi:hypothetical protein
MTINSIKVSSMELLQAGDRSLGLSFVVKNHSRMTIYTYRKSIKTGQ